MLEDTGGEDGQEQDLVPPVGAAAAGVLRFTKERDPAVLTQFVRRRVIDPERAYWLRGIEAATRWLRETGNSELRVPYTYVTPEGWEIGWQRCYRLLLARVQAGGALPAGPGDVVVQGEDLGVWIAGQVTGWDRLERP